MMKISKNIFALFFSLLILMNFISISAYQDNVDEGTYATYSFSASFNAELIEWMYCEGTVGWECLGRDGDIARIKQWIEFTVPNEYYNVNREDNVKNYIFLMGEDYVEMAKTGDLSFIPSFAPEDLELYKYSEPEEVYNPETGETELIGEYNVRIFVAGTHYFEAIVDVDLNTRDVFNLEGNIVGRWLWWINPEQYPLEGQIDEVYRYDWYGQQIDGFVTYISKETYEGWGYVFENRVKGTVDELFSLGQEIDSYEPVDISGEPHYFSAGIQYNATTGMPIWPYGVGLCDDVTSSMTGLDFTPFIIMKDGWEDRVDFTLVDTNLVPTEYIAQGSDGFDSVLPYAVGLLTILLVVAGVMAYRRR